MAYFKSKGLEVTDEWWEVWQEANAKAFAVARSGKMAVLKTIHEELEKSLIKGTTKREFVKTLKPRLQKLGWWGRRADGRMLGSPRRLKTIYRTNMMSSYNAGRWREQARLATAPVGARPYFQYIAVRDSRTRHSHAVLHGKVFRYDDPFWKHFYPPNGFNCRCRVSALTEDQVKRKKLKVETARGSLGKVERPVASKKTGEGFIAKSTVYRGRDRAGRKFSFEADPSFDYNPGLGWPTYSRGARSPGKIGWGQKSYKDYGLTNGEKGLKANAVAGKLRNKVTDPDKAERVVAEAMGLKGPKDESKYIFIKTPETKKGGVRFGWNNARHVVIDKAGNPTGREQFADLFLPALKDPDEVWLAWYSEPGEYRKHYIKVFLDEETARPILVVARENGDGSVFMTAFRADWDYIDERRVGTLLYRRAKAE